jgi:thiol-disulfide isomerase/thioredoxin
MKHLRSPLVLAAILVLMLALFAAAGSSSPVGLERDVAALTQRVAALENELKTLRKHVRANHPDPQMEKEATAALREIHGLLREGRVDEAKPQLDAFMEQYSGTKAGRQAQSLHQELEVVGRPVPDELEIDRWFQGEGEVDLHGTGTTVLVFWETWCPHCRREVPKLEKVYEENRNRGLQVLGLSKLTRGANDESVRGFIDEHALQFPVAVENGTLSSHFGVSGIPAVAVVQQGRVIWRGHPARMTPEMLESWLR